MTKIVELFIKPFKTTVKAITVPLTNIAVTASEMFSQGFQNLLTFGITFWHILQKAPRTTMFRNPICGPYTDIQYDTHAVTHWPCFSNQQTKMK